MDFWGSEGRVTVDFFGFLGILWKVLDALCSSASAFLYALYGVVV